VQLFSLWVDAGATLMRHTEERAHSNVRRGTLNKLLLVLAISMVIGLGASVASAATRCNPVLTPGENLSRVAAHCPPSTTFTIKDGTYKLSRAVKANSGDTFKGVYSDATRPKIDANGALMAFNVGDTKGVTISGISISGTGGSEWCEPACGGAIKKDGWNLHVLNVRLHHNPNQGISNPGPGFVLKNSEIDHNGSASFTKGGTSSAAGVKITKGPATFRDNEVHHNYWHGIWCDEFAGSIEISHNAVHHNGKNGIRYETCRGPSSNITNNRVFANGHLKKDKGSRAGIVLVSAQGVGVANNIVRGNRGSGIRAKTGDRQRTSRVRIHHNTFRNDTLKGCKLAGVVCRKNGK
jgi:Right handed beta helix region